MQIYLNTKKAADQLGLSPWTLIKWRSLGKGPAWLKLGARVRYRPQDLDAFESQSLVHPAGGLG
jgi:hypothetical protein